MTACKDEGHGKERNEQGGAPRQHGIHSGPSFRERRKERVDVILTQRRLGSLVAEGGSAEP